MKYIPSFYGPQETSDGSINIVSTSSKTGDASSIVLSKTETMQVKFKTMLVT